MTEIRLYNGEVIEFTGIFSDNDGLWMLDEPGTCVPYPLIRMNEYSGNDDGDRFVRVADPGHVIIDNTGQNCSTEDWKTRLRISSSSLGTDNWFAVARLWNHMLYAFSGQSNISGKSLMHAEKPMAGDKRNFGALGDGEIVLEGYIVPDECYVIDNGHISKESYIGELI